MAPDPGAVRIDLPAALTKSPRRRGARKAADLPASALAQPLAPGQARASMGLPEKPMAGGEHYGAWLEQQKIEAMMSKLSDGTRIGHEGGWRQRCAYRRVKRQGPWLPGPTREERMTDEDALIGFCILFASVLHRTEGPSSRSSSQCGTRTWWSASPAPCSTAGAFGARSQG